MQLFCIFLMRPNNNRLKQSIIKQLPKITTAPPKRMSINIIESIPKVVLKYQSYSNLLKC